MTDGELPPGVQLLAGDCREVLHTLPSGYIHCTVTSPPYLGLRNYHLPPSVWGGLEDCSHEWVDQPTLSRGHPGDQSTLAGTQTAPLSKTAAEQGACCRQCGAWQGCLGQEPTVELYVTHLVEVFREVKRVLRDDGVCWLNLGDSMAQRGGRQVAQTKNASHGLEGFRGDTPGFSAKQLLGVPWRTALALQADGWYLRSAIPWIKTNGLPESTRDRPTTQVEYLFMLTKSARYFYDGDAVRLPIAPQSVARGQRRENLIARVGRGSLHKQQEALERGEGYAQGMAGLADGRSGSGLHALGRARRTTDWYVESLDRLIDEQRDYLAYLEEVQEKGGFLMDAAGEPLGLVLATQGYARAHFATFPPRLVEPLVLSGTSEVGCCPACGKPWARVVEREDRGFVDRTFRSPHKTQTEGMTNGQGATTLAHTCSRSGEDPSIERGWLERVLPPDFQPYPPVPCTVLDPFAGSGTTLAVAVALGRKAIGIELSEEYRQLAQERIPTLATKVREARRQEEERRRAEAEREAQLSLFDQEK